jgi:hypothetical protein
VDRENQHSLEIQEFLLLMEHLDQHLEDGLVVVVLGMAEQAAQVAAELQMQMELRTLEVVVVDVGQQEQDQREVPE